MCPFGDPKLFASGMGCWFPRKQRGNDGHSSLSFSLSLGGYKDNVPLLGYHSSPGWPRARWPRVSHRWVLLSGVLEAHKKKPHVIHSKNCHGNSCSCCAQLHSVVLERCIRALLVRLELPASGKDGLSQVAPTPVGSLMPPSTCLAFWGTPISIRDEDNAAMTLAHC